MLGEVTGLLAKSLSGQSSLAQSAAQMMTQGNNATSEGQETGEAEGAEDAGMEEGGGEEGYADAGEMSEDVTG